mmetsp:Transcript_759/g.1660  ORF Transcript_759/g.1660 Transcript_759/m.1660 type:complete len:205 (+) Transcript_759:1209-1823(+)
MMEAIRTIQLNVSALSAWRSWAPANSPEPTGWRPKLSGTLPFGLWSPALAAELSDLTASSAPAALPAWVPAQAPMESEFDNLDAPSGGSPPARGAPSMLAGVGASLGAVAPCAFWPSGAKCETTIDSHGLNVLERKPIASRNAFNSLMTHVNAFPILFGSSLMSVGGQNVSSPLHAQILSKEASQGLQRIARSCSATLLTRSSC